jgi:hypothetical protein
MSLAIWTPITAIPVIRSYRLPSRDKFDNMSESRYMLLFLSCHGWKSFLVQRAQRQMNTTSKLPRHRSRSPGYWKLGLNTCFKTMASSTSENENDKNLTDFPKTYRIILHRAMMETSPPKSHSFFYLLKYSTHFLLWTDCQQCCCHE